MIFKELVELRKKAGISHKELGRRLVLSPLGETRVAQTIKDWENFKHITPLCVESYTRVCCALIPHYNTEVVVQSILDKYNEYVGLDVKNDDVVVSLPELVDELREYCRDLENGRISIRGTKCVLTDSAKDIYLELTRKYCNDLEDLL